MKKKTCRMTKKQYKIMVNFMETHGNLYLPRKERNASDFHKFELWDQLTSELNEAGIPSKRGQWALIWFAFKYKLQRRLMDCYVKGTLESIKLTPLKNKIREILGLTDEKVKSLHEEKVKNAILNKVVPNKTKDFYIKLYEENKLKMKKNVREEERRKIRSEANKSWRKLTLQKRFDVINVHKGALDARDLRIANCLENVELNQLPMKHQSNLCENNADNTQMVDVGTVHVDLVDKDEYFNLVDKDEYKAVDTDMHEEDIPKEIDDTTNYLISNDDIEDSAPVMDASMEDNLRSLPREVEPPPPPPVVTTAEELFNLLQTSQEVDPRPWTSLPEGEKRQFHRAITSLKKDNLRQYRTYLHNLSSEDLHKHMVQTLFSDVI